jgi:hypothetical protein
MLEWFPVPPERKAKIESQIKSGINRVYREIQREEEEAAGITTTDADEPEEYDELPPVFSGSVFSVRRNDGNNGKAPAECAPKRRCLPV